MTRPDISAVLAKNIQIVKERIAVAVQGAGRSPDDVTVLYVTKYVDSSVMMEMLNLGCTDFGENRWQQAEPKIKDIAGQDKSPRWHFIGKLQSNKVNKVVGKFDLIHSVDSLKLVDKIQARAKELNIQQNILLQLKMSQKATKSGIQTEEELHNIVEKNHVYSNINCLGLMVMTDLEQTEQEQRLSFRSAASLAQKICLSESPILSMGMSSDFELAIAEGSTIVRIGSLLYDGMD